MPEDRFTGAVGTAGKELKKSLTPRVPATIVRPEGSVSDEARRCVPHGLAVGRDGRCVLCRKEGLDPNAPPPPHRGSSRPGTFRGPGASGMASWPPPRGGPGGSSSSPPTGGRPSEMAFGRTPTSRPGFSVAAAVGEINARRAVNVLFAVASVEIIAGLVAEIAAPSWLVRAGADYVNVVVGVVYAGLALTARRFRSTIALAIATGLFGLEALREILGELVTMDLIGLLLTVVIYTSLGWPMLKGVPGMWSWSRG